MFLFHNCGPPHFYTFAMSNCREILWETNKLIIWGLKFPISHGEGHLFSTVDKTVSHFLPSFLQKFLCKIFHFPVGFFLFLNYIPRRIK